MKENIKDWEENQEKHVNDLTSLEDCYVWLKSTVYDYKEFGSVNESEALARAHLSMGTWIRNTLNLWEDCNKDSKEKSTLLKWFNEKGIYHPDDVSGIILTSFHRHLNNKDIKLDEQIKVYRNHWAINAPKINKGIMS